ncbi:polysaccharide deacetylase family protein [Legionella worsleiensis]|uniref:Polysaccharide deacetylase n=1 Tax=Legionella worsleiensis TaxID=45076 RepID=A0A0W1A3C5_9GAMM|nr:polysaccharide deacetylase family protein [Legionella worsleiensis]KTD75798.1 polysaccharide deacetylase [Legionella worsleiensis]STY32816.1 polysaccharide deacetylase [Legionella worsleiensis]
MKIKSVTNAIVFCFILLTLLSSALFAHKKEIAITIDDLPFVGEYRNFHLNMIMNTMKEHNIPATGFIIAREVRNDNWEILQKFRESGFGLGNHTYSHANLNALKTKEYIKEIKQADTILAPVLTEPKYFRYPYLAMSSGSKKNKILCYLAKKNYQVAPITIDSKDFVFNQRLLSVPEIKRRDYLGEMKPFYLDFIWQQTVKAEEHTEYHHNPDQAQILLIHANLLNAYVLPDIIKLYKEKGYTFVNLEDALKTFKESAHCPKTNKKPQLLAQKKVNTPITTDKEIESFIDWD